MTPTILFYNLENEKGRRLKLICLKLKIRIKLITPEQYHLPIGCLAGVMESSGDEAIYTGTGFCDEMLVMRDFDNRLLDRFLLEFKKNKIERVGLKAVLTSENVSWNSLQLHDELKKEHEATKNGIS